MGIEESTDHSPRLLEKGSLLLCGSCHVLTDLLAGWRYRYFELTSTSLAFYKGPSSPEPVRILSLKAFISWTDDPDEITVLHGFKLSFIRGKHADSGSPTVPTRWSWLGDRQEADDFFIRCGSESLKNELLENLEEAAAAIETKPRRLVSSPSAEQQKSFWTRICAAPGIITGSDLEASATSSHHEGEVCLSSGRTLHPRAVSKSAATLRWPEVAWFQGHVPRPTSQSTIASWAHHWPEISAIDAETPHSQPELKVS